MSIIILIDGREIAKKRGIGHFTRELLFHLNRLQPTLLFRLICIAPAEQAADYAADLPNIEFRRGPDRIGAILWEQALIPATALALNADFVLCPNNTFPLVTFGRTRRIIVLHDLIFLHWRRIAGPLRLRIGNLYRSLVTRWTRPDDLFLTVSRHSAAIIRRHLGLHATVYPNSCDHLRQALERALPYSHPNRYMLHIGGDASTKNTPRVVEAFLAARTQLGASAPDLIILGTSTQFASKHLTRYRFEGVLTLHSVSDAVKCDLLVGALAVIFPSLQEGFGLPIIEAQAAGRMVITSNRRPMQDLVRPSDRLVDPLSTAEITEAIVEAASDPCGYVRSPPSVRSATICVLEDFLRALTVSASMRSEPIGERQCRARR